MKCKVASLGKGRGNKVGEEIKLMEELAGWNGKCGRGRRNQEEEEKRKGKG